MQTDTKQLEAYERIIQNLFTLKEGAMETRLKEIDAKQLETYKHIIQNLFTLKEEAIETKLNETDAKELEAYERIIQNLFTLKEEAIETKHQAKTRGSDRDYIAHALRPKRLSAWPQFISVFYYPQN